MAERYKLLMVGAGTCSRIFEQMERFPIDIIGNCGMQYARPENGQLNMIRSENASVDEAEVRRRAGGVRKQIRIRYTVFGRGSL